MSKSINLDNIQKAFDFLSETKEGQKALGDLRKAMDSFSGKIQPAVNGAEAVYIFRALTNQMSLTPDKEANLPAVANDKTLHGLLFQKKPGEVTRLGSKIDSAALLRNVQGFRIKLKI